MPGTQHLNITSRKLQKRKRNFASAASCYRVARWAVALAIALAGLALAHPLLAQGCALCYNTAASTGARGITALRNGILILMIPPVVIFGVVCFFTVQGRNRFNDEVEGSVEPVIPSEARNVAGFLFAEQDSSRSIS